MLTLLPSLNCLPHSGFEVSNSLLHVTVNQGSSVTYATITNSNWLIDNVYSTVVTCRWMTSDKCWNEICASIATFWTNPQYHVKVVDADPDDKDGTGSLIIGLMQKDRRKLRREGLNELTIGYAVYKVSGLLLCYSRKSCGRCKS